MTGRIITRRSAAYVPGSSRVTLKSVGDNANHVRSVTNFEPWHVPGTLLWLGNYSDARATRNTQPTPDDWDMETAGVARWTPVRTTLTKVSGYAGSQALRLTPDTTGSHFGYQVGKLVAGNRYKASVWCRVESGAGIPFVGYAQQYADGTNSGTWQYISGDATEAGTIAGFGCGSNTTTVDFDDLGYENLSLASYTPAYLANSVAGSVFSQATASAMPWDSSDGLGIRYNAGDYLEWSTGLELMRCLHDGTGGTIIVCVRPTVVNGVNVLASSSQLTGYASIGFGLIYTPTTVRVAIYNGGGIAPALDTSAAATFTAGNTYVLTLRVASGTNGVTIRQNGVNRLTGTLATVSTSNPENKLRLGSRFDGDTLSVNGVLGQTYFANRVLTDIECTNIENYILSRSTL